MTALDDRLRALQQYVRDGANALRHAAGTPGVDPGDPATLPELPLLDRLGTLQIPARYAPDPLVIDGEPYHLLSAVERVVFYEEATAYGDAALLLAAPGSLTAGLLVAQLGDEDQQRLFFGRLRARPTRTFLAMTEPQGGSDAATLHTTLTPRPGSTHHLLNGAKRYVGNAHLAELGVVTARTGPGPLGIRCALVDTAAPGFHSEPLPTLGLRGVLGSMVFDDVEVPEDQLLGRHLSPTRRGMWGWLHSFNPLRCVAAAIGVGIARAACDYVHRVGPPTPDARLRLAGLQARVTRVQSLTRQAARAVDADPANAYLPAAAKVRAARLAEYVTRASLELLGPGARLEHPPLERWARDARGIEFMEGTSHIQRMTVFNALTRGGVDADTVA